MPWSWSTRRPRSRRQYPLCVAPARTDQSLVHRGTTFDRFCAFVCLLSSQIRLRQRIELLVPLSCCSKRQINPCTAVPHCSVASQTVSHSPNGVTPYIDVVRHVDACSSSHRTVVNRRLFGACFYAPIFAANNAHAMGRVRTELSSRRTILKHFLNCFSVGAA